MSRLNHERVCLIREVALETGIAKPYLAKIFNLLTEKKLVVTKRGYRGGILLARAATTITMLEIVEAVEGETFLGHCLMGLHACKGQHVCPTHAMWVEIKKNIHASLDKITLAEVTKLSQKETFEHKSHCQGLPPMPPVNNFPMAIIRDAMNQQQPHNVHA